MNNIPEPESNCPDKDQTIPNPLPKSESDLTPEEKSELDRLKRFSLHQRMLSRMVTVGYAGLNDEERAYWNSVY